MKNWILNNKYILAGFIGLLLLTVKSYNDAKVKQVEFQTLKAAYENQEKKLKETEQKLTTVKKAKNIVTVVEKIVYKDGTMKETETTTDLTKEDTTIAATATTETSTHVVLPSFEKQYGLGLNYRLLGGDFAQPLNNVSVLGDMRFMGPFWLSGRLKPLPLDKAEGDVGLKYFW